MLNDLFNDLFYDFIYDLKIYSMNFIRNISFALFFFWLVVYKFIYKLSKKKQIAYFLISCVTS
jgi:hypothetical protein